MDDSDGGDPAHDAWQRYQHSMISPKTPWSAARANDLQELARQRSAGADLNARDQRGHSPLTLAAYAGQREATAWLLAHGADPNSADLNGNTVLMAVSWKGELELVQQLLAAGADPTLRNQNGIDASAIAAQFGQPAVCALLVRASARDEHTQPTQENDR